MRHRIGGDDHVVGAGVLHQRGAAGVVFFGIQVRAERRREFRCLGHPVGAHRGRRQHQRRAVSGTAQQQGQGLDGLAQAHVVGQAGAQAGVRQARHPGEAFMLIGAQFGVQPLDHRFERGGAGQRGNSFLPNLVAADSCALERGVEPGSGGQGQLEQIMIGTPGGLKVGKLPAQAFTQGQIFAVAECDKAAA